jgi:hypothetical protein
MPVAEEQVDARDTLLAPQAFRREFQTLPSLITAKGVRNVTSQQYRHESDRNHANPV